ncbi:MAG TPA: type I-U CRISPR-associated RAMP protein Csb1/Cas7u [Planctomycetota bacterium]|nr:type I-U CRISPR-associated RAMP protein Csb1/Cas7u [Planctomycetota bacterium]
MSDLWTKYDAWLKEDGPAALVIREYLMPAEGPDAVVFPPTFAPGDGFPGGYNIDGPFNGHPDGENVCLIDSVGSQANRIEPEFSKDPYRSLVPQVEIQAGERTINLLEVGHRAGDAITRCTELASELNAAFKSHLKGDDNPLAKIAPTSLIFGVWDSRETQARLPRLVGSTIRAFNVRKLTRGAVYIPPADYSALDVFDEDEKAKAEGDKKNPLAQRGFVHNPASGTLGGVIARGGIRRDATLNLVALRLLKAPKEDDSLKLRRYILGLSLVAFTHPSAFIGSLRQGCILVRDPARKMDNAFVAVYADGRRVNLEVSHEGALEFARAAAEKFGVGKNRQLTFSKELAKKDVQEAKSKGAKKRKGQ